jgi:hypothetical protein
MASDLIPCSVARILNGETPFAGAPLSIIYQKMIKKTKVAIFN